MRARLQQLRRQCVECHETRRHWLEFAHWPAMRAEKRGEVGRMRTMRQLDAELGRTRVLCVECHARKTNARETYARDRKRSANAKQRLVRAQFVERYQGRCQCGQAQCDARYIDGVCPVWRQSLFEWDHQPGYQKCGNISTLTRSGEFTLMQLQDEIQKCVPVYRPHHRLITEFRLRRNPQFQSKVHTLPPPWACMLSTPTVPDATLGTPESETRA
jgi:hypothetical protein